LRRIAGTAVLYTSALQVNVTVGSKMNRSPPGPWNRALKTPRYIRQYNKPSKRIRIQVRDFARVTGRPAKTDRLDAELLARFGEVVRPTRGLPDAQGQAFEALLTRRHQLVEMLTADKNRRTCAPKILYRRIEEHIRWLEKRPPASMTNSPP
jgi:Transposase